MNIDLMHGDCLELMKQIPDKSIDMILCDLPYGTTRNKWDKVIDISKIFENYKQKIKNGGGNCFILPAAFYIGFNQREPKMVQI